MSVNNLEATETRTLDRTLLAIRSGRDLEKVCASVESFLVSQLARLEDAINQCQMAKENDRIVKQVLGEFESKKRDWENQRAAEISRLTQASDRLAKGWAQLENERRQWLDSQNESALEKNQEPSN